MCLMAPAGQGQKSLLPSANSFCRVAFMQDSPALVFALTLKRWFRANGWPQKITDDWAKDPGVNYPHGPWASQICGAMKADGYNPRAEFFIGLAVFNKAVADQSFKGIQGTKLRDRLEGAKPMVGDSGRLYGPSDFWSLFAGQAQPPTEYAANSTELTQEDCDEWTRLMRDNFRQICLKHMVNRAEGWSMLVEEMQKVAAENNDQMGPEELMWIQEVLSGLHEPEVEECKRRSKRSIYMGEPLQTAIVRLLGEQRAKKLISTA